jgi:hypothetical protein
MPKQFVQISILTLLFSMNVLRTRDVVLSLVAQHEPATRPGEGDDGESLAPRVVDKHQDGGESGGSKPNKVELTEEQRPVWRLTGSRPWRELGLVHTSRNLQPKLAPIRILGLKQQV